MRVHDTFAAAVETLEELPGASADCAVARPHVDRAPEDVVIAGLWAVWTAMRRVLRPSGTAWLMLSDRHTGTSLSGLPWRVAFKLQGAGWLLRNAVVVPAGAYCTSTQTAFLWAKRARYFFDLESLRSSGTQVGDVVLPGSVDIVERCVTAGCPAGGVVLNLFDCLETREVAHRLGRRILAPQPAFKAAA